MESPLIKAKTQQDLVRELDYEEGVDEEVIEKIRFPGAAQLHNQSKAEIADVFATILKSRPKLISFKYRVGLPYIEVTYRR
jgi:hypothetical protein